MMKAAVVYGQDDIRVQSVPVPAINEGEVLVRVRASGICATDIKMLAGQGLPKNLPAILGHEVAGTIARTGAGVSEFSPGERVAVYPIAVCGSCFYCKRGKHNLCLSEFGLAHGIDGGFAEYVRIPKEIVNIGGVVKIPEHLSFERAVVAEPLSCCLAAARSGKLEAGDTLLVVGAGPMGLLHLKTGLWQKARVFMADIREDRLKMASSIGAANCINAAKVDVAAEVRRLTGGIGADMVVASLGAPDIMARYLPALRKGGTFNIFGGPPAGNPVNIDFRWIHYEEIVLTGTFASTPDDFRLALELIGSGRIEVDDLISHRFTLDDMPEAADLAKRQEIIKGVLLMPERDF
jgi:L-iditol 2-dehydrogenase